MIYHPESTHGHHSIPAANKLKIIHIYPAAPNGYAVEYENMRNDRFFELFTGDYRQQEEIKMEIEK